MSVCNVCCCCCCCLNFRHQTPTTTNFWSDPKKIARIANPNATCSSKINWFHFATKSLKIRRDFGIENLLALRTLFFAVSICLARLTVQQRCNAQCLQTTIILEFCRKLLYVSYFTIQFNASAAQRGTPIVHGQTNTNTNKRMHNFLERISVRIIATASEQILHVQCTLG